MTQAATAANSSITPAFRRKPAVDAKDAKGHAAGTVYIAPDGDILLLYRSAKEANYAGHWGLPGGGVEAGETPELGADREAREEMGVEVPGKKKLLDQRITPNGLVFHTFAHPVSEKFVPKLNDEHAGYAWAPLDKLPGPIHPSVQKTIDERLGVTADMSPEDWTGLREGFLKWTAEEEAEPEHLAATDSSLVLALDRESVRTIDKDGRMHVSVSNISKATVNPYKGSEIPGHKELGLDPNKIYQMLRPADELEKAANTFNGIQILKKHVPVSADDHQMWDIVGATGTSAEFVAPYLRNSLHIWTQEGIDLIESNEQRELSCGYHYRPEMTPGNFNGMRYDGIMRDIVGNHVALVEDGRAGEDVLVGDSTENLNMTKPTRMAALTLGITAASIAPLLAMDSKVTLPKELFSKITTKNFKDSKAGLLAGVRSAIDGKLRKGIALDASMEGLAKAIDAFEGMPEAVDTPLEENAIKKLETDSEIEPMKEEVAAKSTFDAEPLKAFLKEKGMADDDIEKVCGMASGAPAEDAELDDEEKKKLEAEKKTAEDALKTAKDSMKDMVSKPAMDAALKANGEIVAKQVRETERGIRQALVEVAPYVGELSVDLAFDSGDDVRRHALDMLGVEGAKTMHKDALKVVLGAQRKAGAQESDHGGREPIAMDAAAQTSFHARFPGSDRIGNAN